MRPHAPDVHDDPAAAAGDHAPRHGLGEEEDRSVQLEVGVVVRAVLVEIRLRDEESGGIHQQRGVRVFVCQLLAHRVDLLAISHVGGDAPGLALRGERVDGVRDVRLIAADDDCAATTLHHLYRSRTSHPAAATNHDKLAALELSSHHAVLPIRVIGGTP